MRLHGHAVRENVMCGISQSESSMRSFEFLQHFSYVTVSIIITIILWMNQGLNSSKVM